MATNEVAWAPSISGGGDNDFNIPGATKLDNTLDTGTQTPIATGDSSGFSTIPTIAQLNASTGINQVIGYYNRRAANYNAEFGTTLATSSYLTAGVKPRASDFTALLTNISALIAKEGWTQTLAWPNSTPTMGSPVRGYHLAYLRKALALSGTIKLHIDTSNNFGHGEPAAWANVNAASGSTPTTFGCLAGYNREDIPYGTTFAESQVASGGGMNFGKLSSGGSQMFRERLLMPLQLPTYVGSAATASLVTSLTVTATLEALQAVVYGQTPGTGFQPTMGTSYNGTAYDTHVQISSSTPTPTTGTNTWTCDVTQLSNYAGGYLVLILGSVAEFAGTGAGINASKQSSGAMSQSSSAHYFQMTF